MGNIRQLIKNDSGQAMIVALVCLVLGSLIIAPVVSHAGTNMRNVLLKQSGMQGFYAADAGIEDVLWSLKRGEVPQTGLPQNPNNMQVTMNTEEKGAYTLVAGEWVPTGGPHSMELSITSNIAWDASNNAYRYTITCAWTGPGNCWLIGTGARLPYGYDYQEESVHLFGGNLSTAEPGNILDGYGAHLLSWTFPKILFNSPETRTQIFLIEGNGDLEDNYGWAEAQRIDVGTVGELTGDFYVITATATRPGSSQVTGKVVADIMKHTSGINIISWRILR